MAARRLELGFTGGTTVMVTVGDDEVVGALTGGLGQGRGWSSLAGEEGTFWVNLDQLVYVRVPPDGPHGVGFSRA
jgi:hypothetical protein